MAYQSLYRRYRPRRFSDVRGQEHVVRALRNAVREDRVGHAYLFSGPRGTGKTSTARILAKALNCEHLVEGEPDGTCESCVAIDNGTSYDVQELDAASNNGVADVRELISRVALGSPGRTKVYILDEVHMLSSAASAALLKTLEEPPDHVVFVLATTDPQKVLPTIRSRTQHFDFHLLSVEELTEHVAWVIHDAGLDLPEDVIGHVVRAGAGSARDTLSALDQVAAAGGVLDASQPVDDLLDAVAAADTGASLAAVAAVSAGRDPRILGEALLARMRDVFLVRMGAAVDHLAPGDVERVQAWADRLGDRATTRALELVGDALLEMRQAPDARIPLEVALVKITRSGADASLDALLERVARLEAALAGGAAPSAGPVARAAEPEVTGAGATAGSARPSTGAPASGPATDDRASAAASSPPAGRPAPPPPPPARGARPADAARAELAARRGGPGGPSRAATPAAPPAATPSTAAPSSSPGPAPAGRDDGPASSAGTGPAGSSAEATPSGTRSGPTTSVAPEPPAGDETRSNPDPAAPDGSGRGEDGSSSSPARAGDPAGSAAAAGDGSTSAGAPSSSDASPSTAATDQGPNDAPTPEGAVFDGAVLAAIWDDPDLDLRGLTKAMYRSGRWTAVSGSTATLALPNQISRDKCEPKRGEVEAALSARFGVPVTLVLAVDDGAPSTGGGGAGRSGDRAASSSREPAPVDDPDEHLAGTDVHDLPDAPAGASGGLDALNAAFPGSELVE